MLQAAVLGAWAGWQRGAIERGQRGGVPLIGWNAVDIWHKVECRASGEKRVKTLKMNRLFNPF